MHMKIFMNKTLTEYIWNGLEWSLGQSFENSPLKLLICLQTC